MSGIILDILKSGDYEILLTNENKYAITINLKLDEPYDIGERTPISILEVDYSKFYKVIEISLLDKDRFNNTLPFFPNHYNPDYKEIYRLSYDLVKDYLREKYIREVLKL